MRLIKLLLFILTSSVAFTQSSGTHLFQNGGTPPDNGMWLDDSPNVSMCHPVVMRKNGETVDTCFYYDVISKCYVVGKINGVLAGQSNAIGFSQNIQTDSTSTSIAQMWDHVNDEWVVGTLRNHPFSLSKHDNMIFHAGKKLRSMYPDHIVRCYINAQNGRHIGFWTQANNNTLWIDLVNQITVSGTPDIDFFVWAQGEADHNTSNLYYQGELLKLLNMLDAEPWFKGNFYATGMHSDGDPNNLDNQLSVLQNINSLKSWAYYVPTPAGLNDIGDGVHFDSHSLEKLGIAFATMFTFR